WLSPAKIRELQEKKLRRLGHPAYRHGGKYPQRFDEPGLKPGDIRTAHDPPKVALLPKGDVRGELDFEPLSANPDKRRSLRGPHEKRVGRRAVRLLRGPASAGDPLGCDAAQSRVDGLAIPRSDGPAMASDARHEPHAGGQGADRRLVSPPPLHPGIRALRRE